MPTPLEFAQMSEQVYKTNGGFVPGWTVIRNRYDPRTGFGAAIYQNDSMTETVIAFRGTDTYNVANLLLNLYTNIRIFMGIAPNTLDSAQSLWREQRRKNGVLGSLWSFLNMGSLNNLYFTGHSLGAVLAELMAYKALMEGKNCPAVTFESPGCANLIPVEYHARLKSRIRCYLSAPNRINTLNPHVGKLYRLFINHVSKFNLKYKLLCISADAARLGMFAAGTGLAYENIRNSANGYSLGFTENYTPGMISAVAGLGLFAADKCFNYVLSSCLNTESDWLQRQHAMSNLLALFSNEDGLPTLRGTIHSWPSFSQYNIQHTIERCLKNLIPFLSENYGIRMITSANEMFENQIVKTPGYDVQKEELTTPREICALM